MQMQDICFQNVVGGFVLLNPESVINLEGGRKLVHQQHLSLFLLCTEKKKVAVKQRKWTITRSVCLSSLIGCPIEELPLEAPC